MKAIIAAVHGIMTNQTDASWPDQFDAWMFERDPEVKVLKKEYRAGPFPRWNCWVRDPLLARSLANELELFVQPSCSTDSTVPRFHDSTHSNSIAPTLHHSNGLPSLWLVAHSNGAVIALLTARSLIARGHTIAGLIFTGAACDADIERNGVLEWQCRGMLGSAIAYCSAEDEVLAGAPERVSQSRGPAAWWTGLRSWFWGKCIRPYGCLGRAGWMLDGRQLHSDSPGSAPRPAALFTRWFSGGHSGYFAKATIARTFEQIYRDIKIAETPYLKL
jgi:hypothetical protein